MAAQESTKSPAFRFYPNDFLSDRNVVVMSMQERGAYITLICYAWNEPLPADVPGLSKLCGIPLAAFRKIWPALSGCFREQGGRLVHPRLERERQKQSEYRQRQSDRGVASGASRRRTKHEPETNAGSLPVQPETNAGSIPVEQERQPDPQPKPNSSFSSSFSSSPSGGTPTLPERAGAFCEWYGEKHEQIIGIGYVGNPRTDYEAALRLCQAFTDAQVRDGAVWWFGMDDKWATEGTRTIGKYASRASDCVQRAAKVRA